MLIPEKKISSPNKKKNCISNFYFLTKTDKKLSEILPKKKPTTNKLQIVHYFKRFNELGNLTNPLKQTTTEFYQGFCC